MQHNYYSGKNCLREIRAGNVAWSIFLQMVKNAGAVQQPKPVTDNNKYRVLQAHTAQLKLLKTYWMY